MEIKHEDRAHAKLSASGAERWLNCTASIEVESQIPDKASGIAAKEGTFAHELSELYFAHKYQGLTKRQFNARLKKFKTNEFYTDELAKYVQNYVDYIEEYVNEVSQETGETPFLAFETKLDLSKYVPESFGTGDVIIVSGDTVHIIDLKFGVHIKKDAPDNPQLRLYALGALELEDVHLFYDIENIVTTIVQPRLDHISSEYLSVDELVEWGEKEVSPKALEAWNHEGVFVPGKHCTFCKVNNVCRARAKQYTSIVDKQLDPQTERFKAPKLLTNDEITNILHYADDAIKFFKGVIDESVKRALDGETFEGFKLVEKSSRRKIINEDKVIEILTSNDYDLEVITKTSLLPIGQLEKAVGKATVSDLLADYVVKPEGAPELAPESDKRPAIGSESAQEDFKDLDFNL